MAFRILGMYKAQIETRDGVVVELHVAEDQVATMACIFRQSCDIVRLTLEAAGTTYPARYTSD